MLRVIAISMILVLSASIMLPFANEAHGIRQTVEIGQQRHKRHRSKAWWRRYRARQRQKRLAAEMAHRNASLALPQNISVSDLSGVSAPALPALPSNSAETSTALPPPVMMAASSEDEIARRLKAWFKKSARVLPWRKTRDPYAI